MPPGGLQGSVVTGTGLHLAPQGVWKKILRPAPHKDLRAFGSSLNPQGLGTLEAPPEEASALKPPEVRAPRTCRETSQRRGRGAGSEKRQSSQDVPTTRQHDREPKSEEGLARSIAPSWFGSLANSSRNTPGEITLLASVFAERPPVVFFDYDPLSKAAPRDCSRLLGEEEVQALGISSLPQMFFCLQTTRDVHEYNAVVNTFRTAGFERVSVGSPKFSIYWGPHPAPEMLRGFNPYQKANHFPGSWQLGRKDLLGKNIYRMKRQFPKDYNILPAGFTLPEESTAWSQAREKNPSSLWIWKPINLSCGKGIRLFSSSIPPGVEKKITQRAGIVQRYVDRPLLINGFKFDLRLYVVVTSFDPLKVYIYQEGLVRLATQKYQCSADSLEERTMHLTNYSINKHAASYKQNLDKKEDDTKSKVEAAEADALEGESDEAISDLGDDANEEVGKISLAFSELLHAKVIGIRCYTELPLTAISRNAHAPSYSPGVCSCSFFASS
ncbi:unnamed protein product [Durusdinium trenchii]|uniref:Tubulin--tyrosine ligase-like protein 5 n=1 Tax=Durusdinium trenchii TaxID=1381693 RepID=A0ABP0SN29_9DINO